MLNETEAPLPTKKNVDSAWDSIFKEIAKIKNLRDEDLDIMSKSFNTMSQQLELLKSYEGIDHFSDIFCDPSHTDEFKFLVSAPNTAVSSLFVSILTDICEQQTIIDVIKKSEFLYKAISVCLPINENNIQTDAQLLYNTFDLISIILDGCEDAPEFAKTLLNNTDILTLIKRQLQRDEFDDNVLAATETLAILLQLQPEFITTYDTGKSEEEDEDADSIDGLLNLLLRFVVNERNPKSSNEDEAAHNGFNAITLFALNEKGADMLAKQQGIEMLLSCWSSKVKTAPLAIKSIETALAASTPCCIQFIQANGLKKLSKTFTSADILTSKRKSVWCIGILDALLTMLPLPEQGSELDPNGECFIKVLKMFQKDNCKNSSKLIKISEFIFENVTENDSEMMDSFQMASCCIAIISHFSKNDVMAKILLGVATSETIDFQLIIDSATLRIDDAPSIAERVESSIQTVEKLKALVEKDDDEQGE